MDVAKGVTMAVRILNEQEIREVVAIDPESLGAVEDAFTWLADGLVNMPPIMHIEVGDKGDIDAKGGYVAGQPGAVIKVAAGFYGNAKLGLPSGSGLMIVLDAETGRCRAVLLDNGYLTNLRTGLAGAVAARHLAREDARVAGVIGAGAQARFQIHSLQLVRPLERLLVWSRSRDNAARYATEMGEALGIPVEVQESAEALVHGSDVVVTTTQSREPLIEAEWLHPGLHITAMGSDFPAKQELAPAVLAQADMVVVDRRAQCELLGELHHALAAGVLGDDAPVIELGEVTSGRKPGRTSAEQVTVCDLTGTGVQDVAIALLTLRKATELGLGTEL
jgi:ectoine utilization protein EutC